MSAPKGNRFWEARSSHGANPIFADGESLWAACLEYFAWVDANPLKEAKVISGKVHKLDKMRAMTISGLCIFLDVTDRVWRDWRKERKDLIPVITRVEQIIKTQKFEGAAADLLNSNIIARDLGLADKQELTGQDGGPIEVEDGTANDLARKIAFAMAKGMQAAGQE